MESSLPAISGFRYQIIYAEDTEEDHQLAVSMLCEGREH